MLIGLWVCKGGRRDYKQQVWVLYEVDFGFLANVEDLPKVVSNLGRTVEAVFGALNGDRG